MNFQTGSKVADEYLPELFNPEILNPSPEGLEEFQHLFSTIPVVSGEPAPEITGEERSIIDHEIDKLHSHIEALQRAGDVPFVSADEIRWIKLLPPALWKRVAEAMCTVGWGRLKHIGAAIWNYDQMCEQFRDSSLRPATGLRRKSGSPP